MRKASRVVALLASGLAPAVLAASACTGDEPVLVAGGGDATTEQSTSAEGAADTGGGADTAAGDAGDASDAGGGCDKTKPFSAFTNIAELNSTGDELGFTLSPDELHAVVITYNTGSFAVFSTSRMTTSAPFTARVQETLPLLLDGPVSVALATDPKQLYFTRGGLGELWRFTRGSTALPFGGGVSIGGPSGAIAAGKKDVFHSQLGTLFVTLDQSAPTTIHEWSGAGTMFMTGLEVLAAEDAGAYAVSSPVVSKDGARLFYVSTAKGAPKIHSTFRTGLGAAFPIGTVVAELSDNDGAKPHFLSDDECRLYFSTNARVGGVGGVDLWMATRGK